MMQQTTTLKNETFSKLDGFHYPKVIPNIQRRELCNVIYAKSFFRKLCNCNLCTISFFFSNNKNALNAFFDEMRIYLLHAFYERECTQSDFYFSIIKQCNLSSMVDLKKHFSMQCDLMHFKKKNTLRRKLNKRKSP